MKEAERIYGVDRIEDGIVVLVPDVDSHPDAKLHRGLLPGPVAEGDVLRVRVLDDGSPAWETATPDPGLREARLENARERLERLGKRDPGGDIVL